MEKIACRVVHDVGKVGGGWEERDSWSSEGWCRSSCIVARCPYPATGLLGTTTTTSSSTTTNGSCSVWRPSGCSAAWGKRKGGRRKGMQAARREPRETGVRQVGETRSSRLQAVGPSSRRPAAAAAAGGAAAAVFFIASCVVCGQRSLVFRDFTKTQVHFLIAEGKLICKRKRCCGIIK